MNNRVIMLWLLLVALFWVGASAIAAKPLELSNSFDNQQKVKQSWHLEQADIVSVISQVSELTGKNFIIDPRVTGKVTIVANTPLSKAEIYQVFLSVLQTLGFSAVPAEGAIKIVPSSDANMMNSAVANSSNPGVGEELVVRVVIVSNATAAQVVPILRPLLPQWAHISAYNQGNTIILSGAAANVSRLVTVIREIDEAADDKPDLVALQNANAMQISNLLNTMENANRYSGRPKAVIVADEASNRILLSGDKIARMRMRVLISQLDQSSSRKNFGDTAVIPLHYLNAKTIAPILSKIAESNLAQSTVGDQSGLKSFSHIEAEEDTNSLVVTAPNRIIQSINSVIQRLDVRPAQVLIQALIVELSESDSKKFGIEWGLAGADESAQVDNREFLPGVGILRKGRFKALVAAIEGMSDANVLSTPTVVVMNNKKAVFNVGKQVSIQTTESGPIGGTTSEGIPLTTSTFKQEDVGLKLDVKPQINRNSAVLLTVEQHDGSLQNPDNPTTTPIINKSDISTTVMVNSGDTLVIGGLISNDYTDSVNKTPLLGDIPLIGEMFTYRDKHVEKKKLMVFIHPVVLRTPLDGTNVTDKNYNEIRRLQVNWENPWRPRQDDPSERVLPVNQHALHLPDPFDDEA